MDVGLDNINELHLATRFEELEHIEWLVEANSLESLKLWEENHTKVSWIQKTSHYFHITEVNVVWQNPDSLQLQDRVVHGLNEVMPINITFNICTIDGHDIAFYSCDSMVVHYGLVEAWLIKNFRRTRDNYTRWNHCNAMNFSIHDLKITDKNPREFTYSAANKYEILAGIPEKPKVIIVKDKFDQIIEVGDCVDVQNIGLHEVFMVDNNLCFKSFVDSKCTRLEKVSKYFSNDLEIKYKAKQKVC